MVQFSTSQETLRTDFAVKNRTVPHGEKRGKLQNVVEIVHNAVILILFSL